MGELKNIGVLGSGSWGTAMIKMLTENSNNILWHVRDNNQANQIINTGKNPKYLKDLKIDIDKVFISNDIKEIILKSQIIIITIPSPYIHENLIEHKEIIKNKIIFSGSKGVIPESHLVISEHLNKFFNISYENLGILSGPTHAEEIAKNKLSYLTIGSTNKSTRDFLSTILSSSYIKTSISEDIIGIEYAAALKNIYSILVGI